jgi:hypothetical protein
MVQNEHWTLFYFSANSFSAVLWSLYAALRPERDSVQTPIAFQKK